MEQCIESVSFTEKLQFINAALCYQVNSDDQPYYLPENKLF